jgi:cytochrome c-type biogenesis protein
MLAAVSDPATGVGFFAALGAGIASFLSPCVLPLVPGYLSTVTGVSVTDLEDVGWRRVLVPSLLFIASFSAIFIAFGMTATSLGQTLRDHQDFLTDLAGVFMILMGVLFVASPFVVRLNREWHVDSLLRRAGSGGPVVAGAAFAIAWTPCLGPTLGAILGLAAATDSAGHGAFLLAVYSAGLGIPFLAAAIAFDRMTTLFDAVKRHYAVVVAVGGAILIVTGVLILTGEFVQLNVEAQNLSNDLGISP